MDCIYSKGMDVLCIDKLNCQNILDFQNTSGSTIELPWEQTKSCRQNNRLLQVHCQHAPCGRLCPNSKERVLTITHRPLFFLQSIISTYICPSIPCSYFKLVHFCPQLQIHNLLFQLWLQCCQTWVFPCPKNSVRGPVAQWTRHLTTNQGIAGSSPARIKLFLQRYLDI